MNEANTQNRMTAGRINSLREASELTSKLMKWIKPKELIELAKNGLCPHYRLVKPSTGEETILFLNKEIQEWASTEYVQHWEQMKPCKLEFLYFHPSENKVKPENDIPVELSRIKELYTLPIAAISTPPGVYFLCKKGKIKYVGQSINVAKRIINHASDTSKDFDSVYYVFCPINQLEILEEACIRYFNPPLNKQQAKKKPSMEDKQIVRSLFQNGEEA